MFDIAIANCADWGSNQAALLTIKFTRGDLAGNLRRPLRLGGHAMNPQVSSQVSSSEAVALTREEEQAEVIRRLEEDIIFGRFAPGSRLVEDTLMSRYGASRHFVRQGLFQLERQGIVLREKNIGATVRFYSGEEVRQIYEVREMLTRQAALMITLPAPAGLIEQLVELQRQYGAKADAQDLRGIHEANDAFHVALFSACGNPYLVRSLQDYMNLTLPMRAKNLADREGLALSRRQHEFMIELLRGRDSWALAQLCVDHMQYSKSDYLGRIGAERSAD
jgi:DNA-binding GntR family transcriptional regulator